jgi:zinc protease
MRYFIKELMVLLALLFAGVIQAQEESPMIPKDKQVKIGVLPNGLTYYIRHNNKPKDRVDFHIVQKVGSILEEPEQRGLAHFLEHMAFNGTRNFPGNQSTNGVISWCESKGMQFGSDINAGTGIDETIYDIMNVPARQTQVVDSCLLILHDWSHDLLLTAEEIDKERGVIHEELRTTNTGMQRCIQHLAEQIYAGTKYADCLPGGSVDVVDHFKYNTLRDYYKKWYRPDLQGIVVVGDIDPVRVEAKIKEIFADIEVPQNPAERVYFEVKQNKRPIIAIATDPEVTMPLAFWSCKQEKIPEEIKTRVDFLFYEYVLHITSQMMNDRLAAISNQPTSSFKGANFSADGFFLSSYAMDNLQVDFSFENDSTLSAFKRIYTEIERAKRHGFTVSEYERAKSSYLKSMEETYAAKNTVENQVYAQKCIAHFTKSNPLMNIEDEYRYAQITATNIPVEAINEWIKESITTKNQVVAFILPEKEGVHIPTEKEIKQVMKQVANADIAAIKQEATIKELMKKVPQAGKIVKETMLPDLSVIQWKLSNGAEVYVKKTDFETNSIQLSAYKKGGLLHLLPSDSVYAAEMANVLSIATLSTFTQTDLMRYLSDKMVDFEPTIMVDEQVQKAQCKKTDLSTLMQMLYLSLTDLHFNKDKFAAWQSQRKSQLELEASNPQKIFGDYVTRYMFDTYPMAHDVKQEQIDELTAQHFESIYKKLTKNGGAFTFIFVGDVDLNVLRSLTEQYIGALPTFQDETKVDYDRMQPRKGNIAKQFTVEQDENKTSVFTNLLASSKYDLKTQLMIKVFSQIMNYRLYKKMREDEGGVYSPYIDAALTDKVYQMKRFLLFYDTDPNLAQKMGKIVLEDLKDLSVNGPSKSNLSKALKYLKKDHKQSLKVNEYWMTQIKSQIQDGFSELNHFETVLNEITLKDIQMIAKDFVETKHKVDIKMTTKP